MSVSGNRAVMGVHEDDDNGFSSGSAYVFERQANGTWVQVQKLIAGDGAPSDYFGTSVAVSDDRALIGASEDDVNWMDSGSAYMFERQANGTWLQVQKLIASDGGPSDYFGISVAVSDNRALIGTHKDDDNGLFSGSAYVFERQVNGTWTQVQKLLANDSAAQDHFGSSVAVSGDRALIGAYGDDSNSGAADVFERQASGTWTQVQKLSASDGATQHVFGSSVAVSGDHALIGSYAGNNNGSLAGSAYVFERPRGARYLHPMRNRRTGSTRQIFTSTP